MRKNPENGQARVVEVDSRAEWHPRRPRALLAHLRQLDHVQADETVLAHERVVFDGEVELVAVGFFFVAKQTSERER